MGKNGTRKTVPVRRGVNPGKPLQFKTREVRDHYLEEFRKFFQREVRPLDVDGKFYLDILPSRRFS